ncbi:hypothetical protein H5410_000445 [Solanum commersonii]|uniref:Uncharacterized protein n=1 Tax=Solanum commersonii TaxID=4109 RepID=A0A9J6AW65_SOLCO|nr:hypothetical protein H5410_000445 [Solanum commersonii]
MKVVQRIAVSFLVHLRYPGKSVPEAIPHDRSESIDICVAKDELKFCTFFGLVSHPVSGTHIGARLNPDSRREVPHWGGMTVNHLLFPMLRMMTDLMITCFVVQDFLHISWAGPYHWKHQKVKSKLP